MLLGNNNVEAGTINNPVNILAGETVCDVLSKENPNNYYKIELNSSGRLNIDMETKTKSAQFVIFDSDRVEVSNQVLQTISSDGKGTMELELTKGTYFIGVYSHPFGYTASYGNYSFTTYFQSGNATFEDNNTFSSAASIYSGQEINGHLAKNGKTEYFKVNVTAPGQMMLDAKISASYGFFNIYNSEQELVRELIIRKADANGQGELKMPVTKGTYYIEVISEKPVYANHKYGTFSFNVSLPVDSFEKGNLKYSVKSENTVSVVGMVNKKTSSVNIPDTVSFNETKYKVTAVEKEAFKNNSKLKKIIVGKNVKAIGKSAFYNCKNVTKMTIKTKSLSSKTVGKKAFSKMGSKNYKKLVVVVPSKKVKTYKKLLKDRGLSSKANVKK